MGFFLPPCLWVFCSPFLLAREAASRCRRNGNSSMPLRCRHHRHQHSSTMGRSKTQEEEKKKWKHNETKRKRTIGGKRHEQHGIKTVLREQAQHSSVSTWGDHYSRHAFQCFWALHNPPQKRTNGKLIHQKMNNRIAYLQGYNEQQCRTFGKTLRVGTVFAKIFGGKSIWLGLSWFVSSEKKKEKPPTTHESLGLSS